jgi:serine/threonine protein kinase
MLKKYKKIKELNKGYSGITYLVEKENIKYVLKRQKILPKETKKDYKYQIWREIDFGNFVNSLSKTKQNYFMKMYEYDLFECDYKHKPRYVDPNFKKELDNRNKSKYCVDMLLEYKGNVLDDLLQKKLSLYERYCMIIQILYALEIMRENKYMHQDIHPGNITYEKTSNKIKIYGKELKCKYQYSLIDYGLVRHKKYNKTKKEKKEYENLYDDNNDVSFELINQIILQTYRLYGIYIEKKRKFPERNIKKELMEFMSNKKIWEEIKDILYKKNKKWFDEFESKNKMEEKWELINRIYFLFSSFNRKKYLKIIGWKEYLPLLLPKDDLLYMVKNATNNKKIIKYLLNKL